MGKIIAYYGHDWANNVGNAFIDYAIRYCVKEVLKNEDYHFYEASNLPAFLKFNFSLRKPFSYFNGKASDFDLRQCISPDVVILGGSLLDKFWSKIHGSLLNWLKETKTKVIILGGGGGNQYSAEEINDCKQIWKGINVIAFIARDYRTYDNFKDFFPNSYAGIDNAFFLKDCFKPAPLKIEKLGVKAFDLTYNRNIEFPEGFKVVTLGHKLTDVDSFKYAFRHGLRTFRIVKEYDLISDFPDDYLHLYGNSSITHSDRVHACVSTLSFGGKAQYYDKSDRSFLFERVKLGQINKELVQLDQAYISEEKEKQLSFLKEALSNV